MSAHTPGPWECDTDEVDDFSDVVALTDGGPSLHICDLTNKNHAADARLIAAAPAMYDALLEIAHGLNGPDEDFVAFIDRIARAALAKAEGKS